MPFAKRTTGVDGVRTSGELGFVASGDGLGETLDGNGRVDVPEDEIVAGGLRGHRSTERPREFAVGERPAICREKDETD